VDLEVSVEDLLVVEDRVVVGKFFAILYLWNHNI